MKGYDTLELKGHRRACFLASPEFLLQFIAIPKEGIRIGNKIITPDSDCLPEDCRVVACRIDNGQICFTVEHDSFEVEYGNPPILTPSFKSEDVK